MNDLENSFVDYFMTDFYIHDSSPVVVLFGPQVSGKTMALIRLTLFLEKEGYQVVPVKSFRPSQDTFYNDVCEAYSKMCYNKCPPQHSICILLVKVLDRQGRTVCQLLDAPGDFYFDRVAPQLWNEPYYKPYFNRIISLPNKRIWLFFVESYWGDDKIREQYVERIKRVSLSTSRSDKAVFVFNKIDKYPHLLLKDGMPNKNQIFKNIKNGYPGIFTPFENKNPITRLFRKYSFQFVPLSAGAFTVTSDWKVYTPSVDFYPKSLWKAICNSV